MQGGHCERGASGDCGAHLLLQLARLLLAVLLLLGHLLQLLPRAGQLPRLLLQARLHHVQLLLGHPQLLVHRVVRRLRRQQGGGSGRQHSGPWAVRRLAGPVPGRPLLQRLSFADASAPWPTFEHGTAAHAAAHTCSPAPQPLPCGPPAAPSPPPPAPSPCQPCSPACWPSGPARSASPASGCSGAAAAPPPAPAPRCGTPPAWRARTAAPPRPAAAPPPGSAARRPARPAAGAGAAALGGQAAEGLGPRREGRQLPGRCVVRGVQAAGPAAPPRPWPWWRLPARRSAPCSPAGSARQLPERRRARSGSSSRQQSRRRVTGAPRPVQQPRPRTSHMPVLASVVLCSLLLTSSSSAACSVLDFCGAQARSSAGRAPGEQPAYHGQRPQAGRGGGRAALPPSSLLPHPQARTQPHAAAAAPPPQPSTTPSSALAPRGCSAGRRRTHQQRRQLPLQRGLLLAQLAHHLVLRHVGLALHLLQQLLQRLAAQGRGGSSGQGVRAGSGRAKNQVPTQAQQQRHHQPAARRAQAPQHPPRPAPRRAPARAPPRPASGAPRQSCAPRSASGAPPR